MSNVLALMYQPEIGTTIEYTNNKIRKKDGGTDKYSKYVKKLNLNQHQRIN